MKKIYFIVLMLFSIGINAQTGLTCATAVTVIPSATCNYSTYTTSATEMWAKFVATSPTVNISLITAKFGLNATHIHNIALIGGTCSSQTVIAEDELPFIFDADKLAIDLNASGLIIGNTYYIRAKREATVGTCDKSGCKAGGSTSPSTYQLCIENITVIIPADFGLELPNNTYSYLTNRGQLLDVNNNLVPDVKLYTLNANPNLYISSDKVSYVFSRIDTIDTTPDTLQRVDMTLVGANTGTKVFKTETIPGKVNFFLPHTPNGVVNNSSYSRSVSNEVYPYIDMQCYSNSAGEKFYFVVRPGGDADNIVFKFDGATTVTALTNGGLKVTTPLGNIEYEAPHAYQINSAGNIIPMPWQANFLQVTANTVKFDIRNYPQNLPLFIQVDKGHKAPASIQNIEWSTFYGGSGNDGVGDAKTDAIGNMYISGSTSNNAFPVTPGVYQGTSAGSWDAVALKFDNNGVRLWATYIGGGNTETGGGIAFDASSNVYLIGYSSSVNFPVIGGNPGGGAYYAAATYQTTGFTDGFIAKFAPDGATAPWRTCYGGNRNEYFNAIKIDASGNIFIVGETASDDFPMQFNGAAYYQTCISGGLGNDSDGIIIKFNNNGVRLWATCFGGNQPYEGINDIDVDASGNVFVTGGTQSANFPVFNPTGTTDYFDGSFSGSSDAYIAKFTNFGIKQWITLYGGSGGESGSSIVANSTGDIFVAGYTASNDMDVQANASAYYQSTKGSGSFTADAFLLKFKSTLERDWATYYGGTNADYASDLDIDNNGVLYFAGSTLSNNFPTPGSNPANTYSQTYNGGNDSYIAAFDGSMTNIWGTYLGGSLDEYSGTVVSGPNSKLYLIGKTASGNTSTTVFPLDNGGGIPYFQGTFGGGTDGYITRFDRTPLVGINELNNDDSELSVYPNPTNNLLTINFSHYNNTPVKFIVYNALGEIVQAIDMGKKSGLLSYDFDLSNVSNGVYFIQVQNNYTTISKKIIKQ